MKNKIIPIVLAGGMGTRLWPLSRKSYPKQFSDLIGEESLFQSSVLRSKSSNSITFSKPIVMTNSEYRFIALEQLKKIGIQPKSILIEPEAKNTGPAILAACVYAMIDNPDAILLISPSDHLIPNSDAFHTAVNKGLGVLSSGKIVTFGIRPTEPETAYGYLELIDGKDEDAIPLKKFVEKPSLIKAKKMIKSKKYLWNSGIFLVRAKDILKAFKTYRADLIEPVQDAVNSGKPDLSFFRLDPFEWAKCDSISVDYAILENSKNLCVVPFSDGWSDLGSWHSVWEALPKNKDGVVVSGNAMALDCHNVLLRSEGNSQQVVGLGLENTVVIGMPDAVLVANKDRSQEVKKVVESLKKNGCPQSELSKKDHRPWGWFESLTKQNGFQVKRILVNPGSALSLQSHEYRSEHWIVVEGTAKVTINNEIKLLTKGQSTYVPVRAIHRLENPSKEIMILIEVQTGTYLGEDDIIRYDDNYDRNSNFS